ncbi:hypothetical protein BDC45DRAFT_522692 [Circinella umbellata]|nr:hypothetical protein BDC45DRAFT_522692 [Circinella umbellata]
MEISTAITRSQAACILYGESINTENELKCERWLADLEDVDICYLENNPTEPFIVAKVKIEESPHRYKLYPQTTLPSRVP